MVQLVRTAPAPLAGHGVIIWSFCLVNLPLAPIRMNEPATLTTPWGNFILAPGVGRASLRVGRRRLRAPRWCAPFQREYGGDFRGCDRRSDLGR